MPRDRSPASTSGSGSVVGSALLVVLSVAIVVLGRTKLKSEESALYAEISGLERQIEEVRRASIKLLVDYESLTGPGSLGSRIRDMNLKLVMPGEDARIVLPEPAPAPVQAMAASPAPDPLHSPAREVSPMPTANVPHRRLAAVHGALPPASHGRR